MQSYAAPRSTADYYEARQLAALQATFSVGKHRNRETAYAAAQQSGRPTGGDCCLQSPTGSNVIVGCLRGCAHAPNHIEHAVHPGHRPYPATPLLTLKQAYVYEDLISFASIKRFVGYFTFIKKNPRKHLESNVKKDIGNGFAYMQKIIAQQDYRASGSDLARGEVQENERRRDKKNLILQRVEGHSWNVSSNGPSFCLISCGARDRGLGQAGARMD
jgi:hypothetical protein